MKVHLMYQDRDYVPRQKLTEHEKVLMDDLGLGILLRAMAGDDRHLSEVCASSLFDRLDTREQIFYRQQILDDCLKNPDAVRMLYQITEQTLEERRKLWWGISSRYLTSIMSSAVSLLELMVQMLRQLREVADKHAGTFHSPGMTRLFTMLQTELTDDYFTEIASHLRRLKFQDGMLMSANIGDGNVSVNYKLHTLAAGVKSRIKWHFAPRVTIYPRDEAGANDLSRRKDRAINLAANAVGQSADHILSFCTALDTELAFYVGCLNLYDALHAKNEPVCFPIPHDLSDWAHSFAGLYDVCLALSVPHPVVGNDADMGPRALTVITGANQGGKSTFLRSIGQAQLMLECGMFVAATSFEANMASGLFTHYKREEDTSMQSGKLDEELARMSGLIDEIKPNAIVLFNESFASTNEREGSEIARQIVNALLDTGVKVFFVTHMYDLSSSFLKQYDGRALFLRADRSPDGSRSYHLVEGKPLPTSFGEDLYREVFGEEE